MFIIKKGRTKKTMVSITCYGGVGEIGGNKILVEQNKTRLFLDFGMSFTKNGYYYSEFLQPRKCGGLEDFFELDLIPDLKGIYRLDYLNHMGRTPEKRLVDAVFLSHAHADHAQYIHFLRKDIPIYGTLASKRILQVLEETGVNQFGELLTTCDAFTFYTTKNETLGRVTKRQKDHVNKRVFHEMHENQPVTIGDFKVEMIPVDHSLPGACGFLLSTKNQTIAYTGDIRFHGYHKDLSKRFVEKVSSEKIDCLLCEGTRIKKTNKDSEKGVQQILSTYISKAPGLVFVEHPIRDLDRSLTIYKSAKENKRTFVVTLKLAYLLNAFGLDAPFTLDDVAILVPRKSWGLITHDAFSMTQVKKDYTKWERAFIDHRNAITYKDLQKNPEGYVVSMNMWEIKQLIDIQPKQAIWIKSTCEPFNEEMEIDEERKHHWLNHFNIKEYNAHASGHASGVELTYLIKQINPQTLIPVHTQNPEYFQEIARKLSEDIIVIPPVYGKKYVI